MKKFMLSVSALDNFVEENGLEAVECIDGVLIDSVVYATDNGYLFCYEHALNESRSAYRCVFCGYNDKNVNKAWEEWYTFVAVHESDYINV